MSGSQAFRRRVEDVAPADRGPGRRACCSPAPEYNYSMTGVLKNAIDWAFRAPAPTSPLPAKTLRDHWRRGLGWRGSARAQYDLAAAAASFPRHCIR